MSDDNINSGLSDELSHEKIMEFVLSKQKNIVLKLMTNENGEEELPTTKVGFEALTQNLQNMASTSLSNRKIKNDAAADKNSAERAKILATILLDPKIKDVGLGTSTEAFLSKKLSADKDVEIVDGELEVGIKTFHFNDIMTISK